MSTLQALEALNAKFIHNFFTNDVPPRWAAGRGVRAQHIA